MSDSFLNKIISEQNEIMKKNYDGKEKDPEMFMKFAMARCIKTYLLKKYAEQKNDVMHGHWIIDKNCEEICSVCWTPRKASELNGECVMCGARME